MTGFLRLAAHGRLLHLRQHAQDRDGRASREQAVAMLKQEFSRIHAPLQTDDDLLRLLDDALAHLRAADREAVSLRYLENQAIEQISAALSVSEAAARKRIDRAVGKLRDYFIRHGARCSAPAVAALLASHANAAALAPGLAQSLSLSIIQSCHAGASAPALAIAQGVHTMMFIHTCKTACTAALLIGAMALGATWIVVNQLEAQNAPPAPAAPLAATAVAPVTPVATVAQAATAPSALKLDLSTPEEALAAYCQALKQYDRAAAMACCTRDPNPQPAAGDAFLALNLGQNHLISATAKAFKTDGSEARQFPTMDLILSQILLFNQMQNRPAVITGDTAMMPFTVPDSVMATLPQEIQKQVRSFEDHPIPFVRTGGQWRLGPGGTQTTITLLDSNKTPIEDEKIQVAAVQDYAAVMDRIATNIEAGRYANWDQAKTAYEEQVQATHQAYGYADLNITLSPPPAKQAAAAK